MVSNETETRLSRLSKSFDDQEVLTDISFGISAGEVVALTGPSGAGKTTICRMISGLEFPDRGNVILGGENCNAVPARRRGVAHMFESFALYPHLTVSQNVAFPLGASARWKGKSKSEIGARVGEVLELTEIGHLGERLPSQLSGGQKQRVALCRALVQEARAYVLDEPISHLDAKLRNRLRGDIRRRLIATGRPALWCTPDAMDAIAVADRIVVLIDGKVAQVATPDELFRRPANISVAALVGDPPLNIVDGVTAADGGLHAAGTGVKLAPETMRALSNLAADRKLKIGIPPTAMSIAGGPGENVLSGKVYTWEPFGKNVILTVRVGSHSVRVKSPSIPKLNIDETVFVGFDPASLLFFDSTAGRRIETESLQSNPIPGTVSIKEN